MQTDFMMLLSKP